MANRQLKFSNLRLFLKHKILHFSNYNAAKYDDDIYLCFSLFLIRWPLLDFTWVIFTPNFTREGGKFDICISFIETL